MTEEEKAERRVVVGNNKDWDSATVVRQRWLRETLLPRRKALTNAHQFIAATLAAVDTRCERPWSPGTSSRASCSGSPLLPRHLRWVYRPWRAVATAVLTLEKTAERPRRRRVWLR
jgi:hypothetical protein